MSEQDMKLLARRCSANVDLAIRKLEQLMKGGCDAVLQTEETTARESAVA